MRLNGHTFCGFEWWWCDCGGYVLEFMEFRPEEKVKWSYKFLSMALHLSSTWSALPGCVVVNQPKETLLVCATVLLNLWVLQWWPRRHTAQRLGKLCIASAAKDCSMPVKKSLLSNSLGLDWVGGRQRCQLISISEKTNVGQDVICLSLWLLMVFPTQ